MYCYPSAGSVSFPIVVSLNCILLPVKDKKKFLINLKFKDQVAMNVLADILTNKVLQ